MQHIGIRASGFLTVLGASAIRDIDGPFVEELKKLKSIIWEMQGQAVVVGTVDTC
jgi:hypothetical protein